MDLGFRVQGSGFKVRKFIGPQIGQNPKKNLSKETGRALGGSILSSGGTPWIHAAQNAPQRSPQEPLLDLSSLS